MQIRDFGSKMLQIARKTTQTEKQKDFLNKKNKKKTSKTYIYIPSNTLSRPGVHDWMIRVLDDPNMGVAWVSEGGLPIMTIYDDHDWGID